MCSSTLWQELSCVITTALVVWSCRYETDGETPELGL
jgi:hypothetical protein